MFWEKQASGIGSISKKYLEKINPERQQASFPKEILPYIENQHKRLGRIPRVLDVGSGPVSLLAFGHKNNLIELTATDILANDYKNLLNVYGHSSAMEGIDMVNSTAEGLPATFNDMKFDIIYCNNALDHTDSPKASLAAMSEITDKGGYIIISGRQREGTKEGWDGIHMHDLFLKDNILYREGKSEKPVRLDENLPLEILYSNDSQNNFNDMIIVYTKT